MPITSCNRSASMKTFCSLAEDPRPSAAAAPCPPKPVARCRPDQGTVYFAKAIHQRWDFLSCSCSPSRGLDLRRRGKAGSPASLCREVALAFHTSLSLHLLGVSFRLSCPRKRQVPRLPELRLDLAREPAGNRIQERRMHISELTTRCKSMLAGQALNYRSWDSSSTPRRHSR